MLTLPQQRKLLLQQPERLDVLQQRQRLVDVHRSERLRSQVFFEVESRATALAREFALVRWHTGANATLRRRTRGFRCVTSSVVAV